MLLQHFNMATMAVQDLFIIGSIVFGSMYMGGQIGKSFTTLEEDVPYSPSSEEIAGIIVGGIVGSAIGIYLVV